MFALVNDVKASIHMLINPAISSVSSFRMNCPLSVFILHCSTDSVGLTIWLFWSISSPYTVQMTRAALIKSKEKISNIIILAYLTVHLKEVSNLKWNFHNVRHHFHRMNDQTYYKAKNATKDYSQIIIKNECIYVIA